MDCASKLQKANVFERIAQTTLDFPTNSFDFIFFVELSPSIKGLDSVEFKYSIRDTIYSLT